MVNVWMRVDLVKERDKWRVSVKEVMNPQVQSNAGNFWSSWGASSFSGRTLFYVAGYGCEHTDLVIIRTAKRINPSVNCRYRWQDRWQDHGAS